MPSIPATVSMMGREIQVVARPCRIGFTFGNGTREVKSHAFCMNYPCVRVMELPPERWWWRH